MNGRKQKYLGHQEEVKQNEITTKTKESNICRAALYLFQEKTQLQYNVPAAEFKVTN